MILNRYTRHVFVPVCMTVFTAFLPAQMPQASLKGSYVLSEEGSTANGPIASLALLNFSDGGVVSGKEFLRTASGSKWLDLRGSYTLDGGNLGTLSLTSITQDSDGNDVPSGMTYRFAVSASEIQAIRTDGSGLSVASLIPAVSALNGSFVFTEVENSDSMARIVSVGVDNLGNVTGTAIQRASDTVNVSNLTGNYGPGDNGFGKLTFTTQITDSEGNVQLVNETYTVLSAKDRAMAIRTDGPIELTSQGLRP